MVVSQEYKNTEKNILKIRVRILHIQKPKYSTGVIVEIA